MNLQRSIMSTRRCGHHSQWGIHQELCRVARQYEGHPGSQSRMQSVVRGGVMTSRLRNTLSAEEQGPEQVHGDTLPLLSAQAQSWASSLRACGWKGNLKSKRCAEKGAGPVSGSQASLRTELLGASVHASGAPSQKQDGGVAQKFWKDPCSCEAPVIRWVWLLSFHFSAVKGTPVSVLLGAEGTSSPPLTLIR